GTGPGRYSEGWGGGDMGNHLSSARVPPRPQPVGGSPNSPRCANFRKDPIAKGHGAGQVLSGRGALWEEPGTEASTAGEPNIRFAGFLCPKGGRGVKMAVFSTSFEPFRHRWMTGPLRFGRPASWGARSGRPRGRP